ncbi:MAG: hypothetical protein ABI652_00945 [Acidobacteriota bacterium]
MNDAIGDKTNPNSQWSVLRCGRITVTMIVGQPVALEGIGICDPFIRGIASGQNIYLYDTGLHAVALSGAGGNLVDATGGQETLFGIGNGVGEVSPAAPGGTGEWWTKTYADTNVQKTTQNVQYGFVASSMKVEPLKCIQRDNITTGPVALSTADGTLESDFLKPSDGYYERLFAEFLNNTFITIVYGAAGQLGSLQLGLPAQKPSVGPAGASLVRNGGIDDPMAVVPFATTLQLSPLFGDNFWNVVLTHGQKNTIENNADAPTTVDLGGTALAVSTVYVQYRVSFSGYYCCMPLALFCAIPQNGIAFPAGYVRA